ncbi:MAG: hypothetical protein LBC13_01935, partial [Clostridiales bacterium]|nr:hypothetical protein [Clostridiales bacterium]
RTDELYRLNLCLEYAQRIDLGHFRTDELHRLNLCLEYAQRIALVISVPTNFIASIYALEHT